MIIIKPFRAVAVDGAALNRPNVGTALCCQGCMDNGGGAPAPNYATNTGRTLAAQIAEAPEEYDAEAEYQPMLSQLASNDSLAALNNMLLGNGQSAGVINLSNAANSSARQSSLSDLQQLGPQMNAAMLAANPQSAQLLSTLNNQANGELAAGSSLTPQQMEAMQQAARAGAAARGVGGSNAGMVQEMMNQFNLGDQLQQQRQQFAGNVVGMNNQISDPVSLMNTVSNAVGQSQGSNSGAGFDLFNPQAGLGLAQSNFATEDEFDAAQPTQMSQISGLVGSVLGGGGSAMKGAGSMGLTL